MTSLYSLRSTPKEGEFIVMKFDPDYEVESVYALSATLCVCPAGHRPVCRHRKMLPLFLAQHHVDDGWFLDWDTRLWRKPVAESNNTYEDWAGLADDIKLPASTACATPGPQQDPEPLATPMMDNIRTLAAADPEAQALLDGKLTFTHDVAQVSESPAPQAPAPAPEVSRSVGAGAPLKRRRITI